MTEHMISFTKNEQDVFNFAKLISNKMYHDEDRVPNVCKALMVNYNHYNFETKYFDNLCWLAVQQFMMLAFDDKDIRFESTKRLQNFNVKGAYLFEHTFLHGDEKLCIYDATTTKFGQSPVDAITTATFSMNAVTGCRKCNFSGDNCMDCADGKLFDLKHGHPDYKPFKQHGWNILSSAIGSDRSASLLDLVSFYYKWITDLDFRVLILNNPDSWAEDGNHEEFLEDSSLDDYWMKEDDADDSSAYDDEEE